MATEWGSLSHYALISYLEGYGDDGPLGNAHSIILSLLDTAKHEGSDFLTPQIIDTATKILDGVPVNSDDATDVNSAFLAMEREYKNPYPIVWTIACLQAAAQRTGNESIPEIDASDYFDDSGMQKRIPGIAGFFAGYFDEIAEKGYFGFVAEQWNYVWFKAKQLAKKIPVWVYVILALLFLGYFGMMIRGVSRND